MLGRGLPARVLLGGDPGQRAQGGGEAGEAVAQRSGSHRRDGPVEPATGVDHPDHQSAPRVDQSPDVGPGVLRGPGHRREDPDGVGAEPADQRPDRSADEHPGRGTAAGGEDRGGGCGRPSHPGREEAVQEFIDQHNIVYPTLISDAVEMDTFLYKTARESFIGTPTLLVFNPKGELVAVQPGTVTPTELSNFIKEHDQSVDSKNAEVEHAEKHG